MVDFEVQKTEWSSPPVDDLGYIPSIDLLHKTNGELFDIIQRMQAIRYSTEGWRNLDNKWVELLKLNRTFGQRVLDFGCGVGMEALQYAPANYISLADISVNNLLLATKVFLIHGVHPHNVYLIEKDYPFAAVEHNSFDVIHCSGVLHHIPWAREVLCWFSDILSKGGEVRLMVYSDRGWRRYMGSEPPEDVTQSHQFQQFVRTFDQVGHYADWYSEEKLAKMSQPWFEVEDFNYITDDDRYCIATLRKKENGP